MSRFLAAGAACLAVGGFVTGLVRIVLALRRFLCYHVGLKSFGVDGGSRVVNPAAAVFATSLLRLVQLLRSVAVPNRARSTRPRFSGRRQLQLADRVRAAAPESRRALRGRQRPSQI